MKFEEALVHLRAGEKIRIKVDLDSKKTFHLGSYYYYKNGYVWYHNHNTNKEEKAELSIPGAMSFDWEIYTDPILAEKEYSYLLGVVSPFKHLVKGIKKLSAPYFNKDYISILINSTIDNDIDLPCFEKSTLYKNMEYERVYSLKELGLVERVPEEYTLDDDAVFPKYKNKINAGKNNIKDKNANKFVKEKN